MLRGRSYARPFAPFDGRRVLRDRSYARPFAPFDDRHVLRGPLIGPFAPFDTSC